MPELAILSNKEQHERNSKLFGGYAAFVAALLVLTLTLSRNWASAWVVTLLFAISEPALVALLLLDFIVRVVQGRKASLFRGLALFLGLFPSLAGIAILIGHVSLIAMFLFLASTVVWMMIVFGMAMAGKNAKERI